MRRSLLPSLLLLTSLACTRNAELPADETGGESGSDTGGDVCEGFDDEPLGAARTITITNARPEPVYLMTRNDCSFNHVHVSSPAGYWPGSNCEPKCSGMLTGQCGCTDACAAPQLLRIEPGGSYPVDWAYVLTADDVPQVCVGDAPCGSGACVRSIAPPPGDYAIAVEVQLAPPACADAGDPCACPPGETWCWPDAFHEGAPDLELTLDTTLPDGSLELVID